MALIIIPVLDQVKNSLNSFVFLIIDAYPFIRAVHRESALSLSVNRVPITITMTTRSIPIMAQGQYRFQLE